MTTAIAAFARRVAASHPELIRHAALRPRIFQPSCLLCHAALSRATHRGSGMRDICGGRRERLELELTLSEGCACRECGRHLELCALMPCNQPQPEPLDFVARRRRSASRRGLSGADRARTIERLAATQLGVRELSRPT